MLRCSRVSQVKSRAQDDFLLTSTLEVPPGGEGRLEITVDPRTASKKFIVIISVEYVDRLEVDRVQVSGQVQKSNLE